VDRPSDQVARALRVPKRRGSLVARLRRLAPTEAVIARRSYGRFGPLLALYLLLAASVALAVTYGVERRSDAPFGWRSPLPFRWIARAIGLTDAPHGVQEGVSIAVWALLAAAFLLACHEAWRGRLSVPTVLLAAIGLQIFAMLSVPVGEHSDIYQYTIYGRIVSFYHRNPYLVAPRTLTRDPFLPLIDPKWTNLTSFFGPALVSLSAVLSKIFRSPTSIVLAFKLLAGAASIVTILLVRRLAGWIRSELTAFAIVLIGLNPAVAIIGVGGGHNDALIGLAIALGLMLAVVRWDRPPRDRQATELAASAVLTLGAMIKFPVAVVLVVSILVCILHRPAGRRIASSIMHFLVAASLVALVALPFLQFRNPTLGVFTLSRLGSFQAPVSFLWSITNSVGSRVAGSGAQQALSSLVPPLLPAIFLAVFAVAVVQVAREPAVQASLVKTGPVVLLSACGWAVLLFLLASPQIWPWYFVWMLPQGWVLPRLPRVGIAVMSALMPIPLVLAGMPLPHQLTRSVQLYVTAPALLIFFTFLVFEFLRRVRTGTALHASVSPSVIAACANESRSKV
jgi:hypothetical protein